MPLTPEQQAREKIDQLLEQAGWIVQNRDEANIQAGKGVVIREFPLKTGHGAADYLIYIDGKAAGVIEAKKEGSTLIGVEIQSDKYTKGMPDTLPAWATVLPFSYESTGTETRFTNSLEPDARSRQVFAFHRPEMLATWLEGSAADGRSDGDGGSTGIKAGSDSSNGSSPGAYTGAGTAEQKVTYSIGKTFLENVRHLPQLQTEALWPAQITAVQNLERSLADNRPRSLIQMATGSGKTFTAITSIYRLIKFAGARRVLFLVDRGNLADQTLKEFQQYVSPYNNFKFSEEYIIQRLTSNTIDTTARVCICTLQRMYSMLKGRELADEDEETPLDDIGPLFREPELIEYNPAIPIESFDVIITDECHRSIYNLWAQVLDYFDARLIGLTATPNKQTFGYFNQNLVMEYPHEAAVADNVNVNYDVYRIRTNITEAGSRVDAGYYVEKRDRETRQTRWEELDEDFQYDPNQLDRDVVAPDQIRKIMQTFRDRLFSEIFPGRTEVPKTLIFAKDDNHAETIVEIIREEFGKGNDFAQKITYRTTGANPKELIKAFRNSYNPRIAVTVDMVATGTDIKPVEIVFFMRAVKSRSFFEQMKGRGVRVIRPDDLQAVTPDAILKDHFVIVDAVGVCEQDKTDSRPMEKKPSVAFESLLQAVAFGNIEEDVITTVAGRLARMEHRLGEEDKRRIHEASGGLSVRDLSHQLVDALNPDRQLEQARADAGLAPDSEEPVSDEVKQAAARKLIEDAVAPLHNPALRGLLVEIKKKNEITIDHVSIDQVIEAGFSLDALDRARGVIESFEKFIEDNRDEITALQVLYSKPYRARLKFEDVRDLANAIEAPPYLWSESQLWQAYAALDKSKVKGGNGKRILTDLVSLVRYAIHQDNELVPFPERVDANFKSWLASQEQGGRKFTDEQRHWLEMIRDHIAANLSISRDDFEDVPFIQQGGLGQVYEVFGDELDGIIKELSEALVA